MLFSQIPGQESLKNTLRSSVLNNHIAHAQLFSGQEGNASLALALAYAAYINCEDRTPEDSCGKCSSCLKINKIIHPDLHFVFPINTTKEISKDPSCALFMKHWREFVLHNPYSSLSEWGNFIGAENKQLNISADEARNIVKTISLKSFEAEFKVLIIWMVDQMNVNASNATLKILEEPPEKTIFLLITNSLEKILPTILSRTQIVRVPPFTDQEVSQHLIDKFEQESKKATQMAYLADGNMHEAIKLISETEEDNHQIFSEWMRSCYRKDIPEMINWTESFQKLAKENQKNFFQYGLNIFRESLIYKYADQSILRLNEEDLKFIQNFSKVLDHTKIDKITNELNEASYHIERNANAKITFLDLSLNIASILHSK
ncbi:MAG: ATP-binding protein [Cytophagaceae bacterium]